MADDFLNAKQASDFFGVSVTTILRWLDAGKFPNAFQIESTIRIPVTDIEALKTQSKREAS